MAVPDAGFDSKTGSSGKNRYLLFKGLTLLEILIVIGVIGVLSALAILAWQPLEIKRQVHDSQRISDLTNLHLALTNAFIENPLGFMGATSTVYLSLPDTDSNCSSFSLPDLPTGWQYRCATAADYQKANGLGWLPMDLANYSSVAYLANDPVNNGDYYYAYVYSSLDKQWVFTALLQSEKYLKQSAKTDAGVDEARFEIGSNLRLWASVLGLTGSWGLDEIVGCSTNDLLGAHHGSVSGAVLVAGKVGQALQFGEDSLVQFNDLAVDTVSGNFNSVEFWMNWSGQDNEIVFDWDAPYALSFGYGCFGFKVGSGNLLGVFSNGLANQWVHAVAVFYNGVSALNNSKIYLNGEERAMTNCHGSVTVAKNATPIAFLGDRVTGSGNNFTGAIDQLRIYNRVLSAEEARALYLAAK